MSSLAEPVGRVVEIDFFRDIKWRTADGKKISAEAVARAVGIAIPAPIPLRRPTGKSIKDWIVYTSGKSAYYISKLLNQLFNGTSYSFPGNLYWGLWTSSLTASSTGSSSGEATYTGGSYTRATTAVGTTNFSTSSSGGTITNNQPIAWPANTGSNSPVCTYVMVVDNSTTGNMIFFGSITSTTINPGDTPQINTSGLTVTET